MNKGTDIWYSRLALLALILAMLALTLQMIPSDFGFPDGYYPHIFFTFLGIYCIVMLSQISNEDKNFTKSSPLREHLPYMLILAVFLFLLSPLLTYAPRFIIIEFTVLACSFGILTFYSNQDKIKRGVEHERERNEKQSEVKSKVFNERFPILSRIPLLSGLVKIIYLEGFIWVLILIIIAGIGSANILVNIGEKPLHQDEIAHFSTSYGFKETGSFVKWDFLNDMNEESYKRNFAFTYLVYLFNSFLGFDEVSARLPSAMAGIFGIFLIYFVIRLIIGSKLAAIVGSYIYSVNDVILYFSRFIRGYIFLMLISLIILFLCYRIYTAEGRKRIIYPVLLVLFFIAGYHFHPLIVVLLPAAAISLIVFGLKTFPIRKYSWFYIIVFLAGLFFVLSFLGVTGIHALDLSGHIKNFNGFNDYNNVYLRHLISPYNAYFTFIFILATAVLAFNKSDKYAGMTIATSLYIPLLLSMYLFNRYEDFRYISLLQPIFIILISIFLYFIYICLSPLKKAYRIFIIITLVVLIIPTQFPNVPELKPLSHTSIADWDSIDGARIHRRVAQPESEKAFNWIFGQSPNTVIIVRLADGGINWDDDYYLSAYLDKYPDKKLTLYKEEEYYSGKFTEFYNSQKAPRDLKKGVPYNDLIFKENTYIVANLRHLTNRNLLKTLETQCDNKASEAGITRFNYLPEYESEKNNYFPNIFVCQESTK